MLSLLLLLVPASLAGCIGGQANGEYETLSTAVWKSRLDETPNAFVLDVRTPAEYREGHIPGAALIPHTEIERQADSLPSDKSTPVFVYCRSGSRSTMASETLVELGYTNVVNMKGGFPDWARAGYPTTTGDA